MKGFLLLSLSAVVLGGCMFGKTQSLYEVKLVSGERLLAKGKPNLADGFYEFDDVNGQEYVVDRTQVLYVEQSEFAK